MRGMLGGINLVIEPSDTAQSIQEALTSRTELLANSVTVEIQSETDPLALEAALAAIQAAGGQPERIRAPKGPSTQITPTQIILPNPIPAAQAATPTLPETARTEIITGNIRAGSRHIFKGSVIVLGDVNPGAEIIAGGDVIIIGALRGVAHAGQGGNTDAIVWARPIASTQIRIGDAVARSPESSSMSNMQRRDAKPSAELARLQDGVIVIDIQK